MSNKASSASLADILFPQTNEQQDFADGILSIPPEQRKLHTETYDFSTDTIVDRFNRGLIFVPEFQRRYVWSDSQASKLIESLIIQCPIPVIYLNQEADETLSVIDGNQRITSIKRFINNEFVLKGLTAYPELEGLRFHQLDGRFQRHISNRTLRCIVILKDTHPQVKFDVFERLNTGAVKLTPQELRHGLYYGDLINLSAQVAKESALNQLLEIKQDKRMKIEELILRFWALSENFTNYKKPLSIFINNFTEQNRSMTDGRKDFLIRKFNTTFEKVRDLFGNFSFKVFDENFHVESKFNSALYDAEMLAVSQLTDEGFEITLTAQLAQQRLVELIRRDELFRKAISLSTSDGTQINERVNKLKTLLRA